MLLVRRPSPRHSTFSTPPGHRREIRHDADADADAIVIVIGAGLAGLTAAAELATVEREVTARDREMANRFSKDLQISALRGARSYLGDRLVRVAAPHRLLEFRTAGAGIARPSSRRRLAGRLPRLLGKSPGGRVSSGEPLKFPPGQLLEPTAIDRGRGCVGHGSSR